MPARNIYHDAVIRALAVDGWVVTDDPLMISYGGRNLFVDLGAEESTLAAEKSGQRIAVEVQSFLNPSIVFDLEHAVGQFLVYRVLLGETDPGRVLYLALPAEIFETLMTEAVAILVMERLDIRIIAFDDEKERITQWKSWNATEK